MNTSKNRGDERGDWMTAALKSLPRENASADFTEKLLKRVKSERSAPSHRLHARAGLPRPWVWALAAAAVVLALLTPLALQLFTGNVPDESAFAQVAGTERQSLEALLAENRRLTRDLRDLQQIVDEREPVIYLGGDDSLDYVLDLSNAARRRRGVTSTGVMPASVQRGEGGRRR